MPRVLARPSWWLPRVRRWRAKGAASAMPGSPHGVVAAGAGALDLGMLGSWV